MAQSTNSYAPQVTGDPIKDLLAAADMLWRWNQHQHECVQLERCGNCVFVVCDIDRVTTVVFAAKGEL